MRQRLTTITGGLCLVLASSAHALGIGDPQQVSPLHRPLHVVLPLTDGSGLEASQISVAVADDAAYRQSGLSRSSLLDTLSVKVVRREGDLALVLDSSRRVREPFLDLLLVVTWPGGQWQRDVSLLFDPVGYASSQPLLNGDHDPAPGYPMMRGVVAQATAMRDPADDAALATSGPPAWPGQVTVRPGDSLSTLAASLLPRSGLDRQPLMLALYQSNPDAFIDGDIDRLRVGVRLAVPAIATVADISPGAAASRLGELAHQTDDGRPMIDIVGRREGSGASDSDQLAALTRQIADLTAMTERQRATIAALQSERDALQGALAAVAEPSTTAANANANDANASDGASGQESVQSGTPVVSAAAIAAAQAAIPSPSRVQPSAGTASGEKPITASPGPTPASSPSLWQRLLGHLDWIGGGVLIVLLLLWVWERRRRREVHEVAEPVDEGAEAAEPSPLEASRQAAVSMAPRRSLPEVDVDSVSISQADIFMAYGRHAEARDWLRQQLAQKENAQFRLRLLRALGELRDMDALEQALAGFGDDATPEQRQEGQALVDDYRARYVEESWQEATGETEAGGETASQDTVEDVDALFESQAGRVESDAVRDEADEVRTNTDEVRPETDAVRDEADEPAVRSEASPPAESASRTDSMSVLFDDGLTPSAESSTTSSALTHIDYEAPELELDAERSVIASPADSASSSLEGGNETSSLTMPDIDFSAFSLESTNEMAPESGARTDTGSDRPAVSNVVPPACSGERRGTLREVPAGWDVEEVEFEPSHRDNGRP